METTLNVKVGEEVGRWFEQHASKPIYILEANTFETLKLWSAYKDIWTHDSGGGYLLTIGKIGNRPIAISVSAFRIHNQQILKYEPTSQLVDHKMIEEWLANRYPNLIPTDGYHYKTDASNFHILVQHAKQKAIEESGLK